MMLYLLYRSFLSHPLPFVLPTFVLMPCLLHLLLMKCMCFSHHQSIAKRGDCDILYAAYLACVQRKVGLSHVDECFDEGEKYRICSAAEPLPLGRRRLNVPKKYEDET